MTCFPGIQEGTITVRTAADEEDAFDTDDAFWKVHNNALRCIALNADGSLLATASTEGTLIRVWDSQTRNDVPVAELRRGADHSEIFSIAFSHDSSQLCVASDKGSVHVFALPNKGGVSVGNTRSVFKDLGVRRRRGHRELLPERVGAAEVYAGERVGERALHRELRAAGLGRISRCDDARRLL